MKEFCLIFLPSTRFWPPCCYSSVTVSQGLIRQSRCFPRCFFIFRTPFANWQCAHGLFHSYQFYHAQVGDCKLLVVPVESNPATSNMEEGAIKSDLNAWQFSCVRPLSHALLTPERAEHEDPGGISGFLPRADRVTHSTLLLLPLLILLLQLSRLLYAWENVTVESLGLK